MKLDCVITSCNLSPLYCDFIPFFISAWNKLYPDVDIVIVLICEEIPTNLKEYAKYIRVFKPIEGISTAFISQYIRVLYPAILNYTGAVVITDMDIIPMNRRYFRAPLKDIKEDSFVYYETVDLQDRDMYMICYTMASSSTWSEITGITTIEEIETRIKEVNRAIKYVDGHGNVGWNTDQKHLYKYVNKWNQKKERFVKIPIDVTKYCRLDRRVSINLYNKFDKDDPAQLTDDMLLRIANEEFTDYHCYRPYKQYKLLNDKILDIL